MTNYTLNDDHLTGLGMIAEDLRRSAQALVDLVADVRDNHEVDEQVMQAAQQASQAIDANNGLQQRANQGDDVSDREVKDVERQLANADQSVEEQLASLRETTAAHGQKLEEHGSHLSEILEILGVNEDDTNRIDKIEESQKYTAQAVKDMRTQLDGVEGDDNNPGLARSVDNLERRMSHVESHNGADISVRTFVFFLLGFTFLFYVLGLFGVFGFGWITGLPIGAIIGAVVGLTVAIRKSNSNSN